MSIVFVIAFQIFDLSEDVTATAILQVKLAHAMMGYRGSEHKSPSTRPHEGPIFRNRPSMRRLVPSSLSQYIFIMQELEEKIKTCNNRIEIEDKTDFNDDIVYTKIIIT